MLDKIADKVCKILPTHRFNIFTSQKSTTSCLPYYVLCLMIIVGFSLYEFTHNSYLILFIIYGVIPMLDEIFTLDTYNPTPQQNKQIDTNIKFQIPLYITILVDWVVFFLVLKYYSQPYETISGVLRLVGLIFIVSNNNSAQFSIAHQIMHKPGWRRVLGTIHMLKTLNMHFTYEHVYGHHRRVGTPEDPATSKYNQNVYHFFVRSYLGAYKSVYKMEIENGKKFYNNFAVLSVIGSFIFCLFIYEFYGGQCLIFYLLQVLGAVFYLQVINFVQHYGLKRKKLSDGQYQKVTVKHSWNAPHRFSNYLFFKLQRHSDHHQNSMKPYQTLLTVEQSPQLPHGYIVMTLMALFPDIFRKIMNPLVNEEEGNQKIPELAKRQAHAVQQTRKFIVQVSICTCALFLFSCLWIK